MNHREIAAITKGILPALMEQMRSALQPFAERLDRIESRIDAAEKAAAEQPSVMMVLAEAKDEVAKVAAFRDALEEWKDQAEGNIAAAVKASHEAMLAKAIEAIPKPEPGRDADMAEVKRMIEEAVAALPPAEPGKDADPEEMRRALAEAVGAMPKPKDGKDADPVVMRRMIDEAVARIPAAEPGKDADPEATKAMVAEQVAAAVAKLPPPEPGKSVTLEDVAPLVDRAVEKRIAAIPVAKDGVGTAGAIIDRAGSLILTLTDGRTVDLGQVVGKDADVGGAVAEIKAAIAAIPLPKDGRDGVGFDDMTADYDGERTVTLRFARGDQVKEFAFRMPVVIDRGVYREGNAYEKGDAVTWGGSVWIAQEDTSDKPETTRAWRLAVKRGRDGRDLEEKAARPDPGPIKVGVPKKGRADG